MLYRIVGDNIDFLIQRRFQTIEHTNQSIYWTQRYAVLDRVNDPSLDNTNPQKPVKEVQLVNLLSVKEVQEGFKRNCVVLVSRVIPKYVSAFKHMKDVVTYHIAHPHSEEMEKKSEIVSKLIKVLINCVGRYFCLQRRHVVVVMAPPGWPACMLLLNRINDLVKGPLPSQHSALPYLRQSQETNFNTQ